MVEEKMKASENVEVLLPELPPQLFSAQSTDITGEYEPQYHAFVLDVCQAQRLDLARQYIEDAVAFRSVGNSLVPHSATQLYFRRLARWGVYRFLMQAASILFMLSIAFEKIPPSKGTQVDVTGWLVGLNWGLLGLLVADSLVLSAAFGWPWRRPWGLTYSLALACEVVALFLDTSPRWVWLRSGRVVIMLCKLESFQPTVVAMATTFGQRRVFIVMFIYLVVVSFYALIGQVLFGDLYRHLDTEYTGAFLFPGKGSEALADGKNVRSNLVLFLHSFVSLFVLTTTENYPGIMYPALIRGNRLVALLYFGSFCILILYLVLNVVLAATYNGWKQQHRHLLLKNRVRRYQNLLIAWQLVMATPKPRVESTYGQRGTIVGNGADRGSYVYSRDYGDGRLSVKEPQQQQQQQQQPDANHVKMPRSRWIAMLRVTKPRTREENMSDMFSFIDRDGSGYISREEFTLHICDALRFDFAKMERRRALEHRTGVLLCCYDVVLSDDTRALLDDFLKSWSWFVVVCLSIMFSVTLLALRHWKLASESSSSSYDDEAFNATAEAIPTPSPTSSVAHNKVIHSPLPYPLEVVIGVFTCLVFVVEQLLRFVVLPPFECWPFAKQLDLFLSSIYCFGIVYEFCRVGGMHDPDDLTSINKHTYTKHAIEERFCSTCRILIVLRFLTLSRKVRNEIGTTWRIRSTIINFVFVAIVVIYIYACIGVSLMHGHLEPRHLYDGDPGETWVDDASVGQSIVNMNNYGDCFLALLQISVDNNWQDILWANTLESQNLSTFMRGLIGFYFCTFFVFMGWFGLNILTALVIATYDVAKTKSQGAGQEKGKDQLNATDANDLLDQGLWEKANLDAMLMSEHTSTLTMSTNPSVEAIKGGELGACSLCGSHACAVFVPTPLNGALCQCGHGAVYHLPTESRSIDDGTSGNTTGGSAGGGALINGRESSIIRETNGLRDTVFFRTDAGLSIGGDNRGAVRASTTREVRDSTTILEPILEPERGEHAVLQAGWSKFQDMKVLKRTDEVPQYEATFAAEDDLKDPEVRRLLARAIDEAAGKSKKVRDANSALRAVCRAVLARRGVQPMEKYWRQQVQRERLRQKQQQQQQEQQELGRW